MSISSVRTALVNHYSDGAFGMETAYENRKFTPPDNEEWAALFFIPASSEADTQGTQGSDRWDGIVQIDLNYPLDSGESSILAKADAIIQQFKAGTKLLYSGQAVTLKASGRNQGSIVNSQYRISITAGWYSFVSRA